MSVLQPFVRRRGSTPYFVAELFVFRGSELGTVPGDIWEAQAVAYALVLERDRVLNLYRFTGQSWELVTNHSHPWLGVVMQDNRFSFSGAIDRVGNLITGCVQGSQGLWASSGGVSGAVPSGQQALSFVLSSDVFWAQDVNDIAVHGFFSSTDNRVSRFVTGDLSGTIIGSFSERVLVERVLAFPGGFQLPVVSDSSGAVLAAIVSEGYHQLNSQFDSLEVSVVPISEGFVYNPLGVQHDSLEFAVIPISEGFIYSGQFAQHDSLEVSVVPISEGFVYSPKFEYADSIGVTVLPISSGSVS